MISTLRLIHDHFNNSYSTFTFEVESTQQCCVITMKSTKIQPFLSWFMIGALLWFSVLMPVMIQLCWMNIILSTVFQLLMLSPILSSFVFVGPAFLSQPLRFDVESTLNLEFLNLITLSQLNITIEIILSACWDVVLVVGMIWCMFIITPMAIKCLILISRSQKFIQQSTWLVWINNSLEGPQRLVMLQNYSYRF